MWKGYILEIYSRALERRLTFKSQGEKNTRMENTLCNRKTGALF